MAHHLKFSGRAIREIGEAFDWHEKPCEGLGIQELEAYIPQVLGV